jgi:hypothetical protein
MNSYLRLFLLTSIPYGILMGILYQSMIMGLFGGLLFGFIMTLIITRSHKRKGFGISEETTKVRHARAFVVYLSYDKAYDLCLHSLVTIKRCRVQKEDRHQGIIIAKKGMNLHSWGDIILFKVTRIDGARTDIRVSSKPIYPLAFIDYGDNLDNVERISSFIKGHGFDISSPGKKFRAGRGRPAQERRVRGGRR